MISNCGHDENGKYSGGKAGDQTGKEWEVIPWYNRPWSCVLRHPDPAVRKDMARNARAAAKNNLIGYDQGNRITFWNHLQASDYDAAKITVTCETDCSAGVAAIAKATGYRLNRDKLKKISPSVYTGNQRAAFKTAGFEVLTDSKYLLGDKYLLEGDVLLYDGHHTAINLDDGSAVKTDAQAVNLDCTVKLPALVNGIRGGYVKTLQQLLAARGYDTNGIDGIFGSGTETAVVRFQADAGVKANYPGTVGAKTWAALMRG